jgi:hypothetical protein
MISVRGSSTFALRLILTFKRCRRRCSKLLVVRTHTRTYILLCITILALNAMFAVITHYLLCGLNVTQASPLPQLPAEVVSTDAYSLQIAPELSNVCDVPLNGNGFPLVISTVEAVLNYSKVLLTTTISSTTVHTV